MANKTSTDIQIKDIDNWKRGQISYFSKGRMQEDALKTAYNVIFDYDAVVRPRGSFLPSEIPDVPEGLTPLACDFTFKRADDSEGLINVFTDGTVAKVYVLRQDGSTWDEMLESFDPELPVSIAQSTKYVVLGNGEDKFTYYDIADDALVRLEKVDDPTTAPTITGTGFSGTPAFDYYYRVAFNGKGGSTATSPAGTKVASSTLRETWAGARSVTANITPITLDPDAVTWNLYMASVPAGTGAPTVEEYFKIAENLPVSQKTYIDTGEVTMLQSAPVENTTEGIKAPYFTNISGRLWAISKGVVYWGGDTGEELYFGSANGSDSYAIDPDGIERPMAITLGRDNAGTTCINLLTRTTAGQGAVWDVYATTNSVTANGQTFSVGTYQFKKREGNDGTDAPFSVIRANNNAYYLSMVGFKSTGVKPNVSGIQSTDIISSAIRDRVLNFSAESLKSCYAAYYDEALYWTVAYGTKENNEIVVYDILHGGIWSIWRIPADCIFRWASTKNDSPSLYIRQGHKLLRYSKNSRAHRDASGVFDAYIESGLIPFGKSRLEWVHLLRNIWQFDQAIGQIKLTVNIHSKNGDILKTKDITFNNTTTGARVTGGWDAIMGSATGSSRGSWGNRSWNETLADLEELINPTDKKISQKIRKNAAYISFKVFSNTPNTYYELSHLSMLYTYIGVGIEFLSQKGVIKI